MSDTRRATIRGEVEFRILGPLQVVADSRDVTPVRHKQRALLALLLLRANEVVATDELLEALWGESPPASAPTALHGHVSALRKLLGAGAIETRPPGYLLQVQSGQLDAARFEDLVAEARREGDPVRKADLLRRGLSLFRGEPLSDLRYEDFVRDPATRLADRRLAVLEDLFDLELALGRHADLVMELEPLVSFNPLRERLRGQLMLALFRAGRQAEALSVYGEGRRILAEELGIDPGPLLQDLEHKILTQDPSLTDPAALGRASASLAGGRDEPAAGADAPGRELQAGTGLLGFLMAHRAATAVVVVGVGLMIAVAVALRDSGTGTAIAGDAIAIIDLDHETLVGSVTLESRPGAVAFGEGSVWATLPDPGAVVQIDPATRSVVDTIPVGADPSGIAVGNGSIWVTNSGGSTVSRIDPVRHVVVVTIDVAGGPAGIVVGRDGVWVANSINDSVSRIDPATDRVTATVPVGDQPVGLAIDDSGLWVVNEASGSVTRIDTSRGIAAQTIDVGNGPHAIAADAEAIWVANRLDGTVSRIDPRTNSVIDVTATGGAPLDIAIEGGSAWVSDQSQGSVARIDARSGVLTNIGIGSETGNMASGDRSLWVGVRASEASHRGGILTVTSRNELDAIDPALAYFSESWNLLSLTNDGLVGFKRVGGIDGSSLVPDLAQAIPRPADAGRTYTFQLRPDLRYSNGTLVRPDDFRRALERVFRLRSDGAFHFARILGAEACTKDPDSCDLSRGIVGDAPTNSVTFHLVEADPDFLYRLALPFAFAVPGDTSLDVATSSPLPATGPYRIERYTKDKELLLVRNPNFKAWGGNRPDGFADQISIRLGVTDSVQAQDILEGRSDVMFRELPPELFTSLGSNHAGQVHFAPRTGNYFMAMNVTTPPFDDVRVRRAINLALDRDAVGEIFAGIGSPTCQILPPNFPGYAPYCPFTRDPGQTWNGPDLEQARKYVAESGTAGQSVTVWVTPDYASGVPVPVGRYFVDLLSELGYLPELKIIADRTEYFSTTLDPQRRVQIAFQGWSSDYPAESGFIVPVLSCAVRGNSGSQFCDAAMDRRMDEASRLQLTDLAAAHRQWTSIEHEITDLAPWAPLVSRTWMNFVSQRVGNFQVSPEWGPLVDQMWVQ